MLLPPSPVELVEKGTFEKEFEVEKVLGVQAAPDERFYQVQRRVEVRI